MNFNQYFKKGLFSIACVATLSLGSCADDIELESKVNEAPYEAVNRVDGQLLDRKTNKKISTIELRGETYKTSVYFRLTQAPKKGVDATILVDAAYLETYNKEHGTDYKLYPVGLVSLAHNGELLLAPDEKNSIDIEMTIKAATDLEADVSYVIPLRVSSRTEGITFSENSQCALYFVKDMRSQSDCYKGEDAVKTVLYFEVNDANPLNALEFVLKDSGKLFFDEVVLFSANINYNAETGQVYVFNNRQVQFLLDNSEQYLQPLRKRGIKVILGILGNHDVSGVAQLSDTGARMFAKELAAICYAYNLDGVGFDDEYSDYPDLSNPLFTRSSEAAAARLLYETKCAMPDKTVMVYYLGNVNSTIPAVDGILPSEFVDYAVDDYGGAAAPMQGMTKKNCGGMSIELQRGSGDSSEYTARSRKQEGYGYYMFFALDPSKYSTQVRRCQSVCRGLYDDELLYPTHYYKQYSTERLSR